MRLAGADGATHELTPSCGSAEIEPALPVLGFVIPGVGTLSGTARKSLTRRFVERLANCGSTRWNVGKAEDNASFARWHRRLSRAGGGTTLEQE